MGAYFAKGVYIAWRGGVGEVGVGLGGLRRTRRGKFCGAAADRGEKFLCNNYHNVGSWG